MERDDALDAYLSGLRRSAKLSVEDVCQSTKIQARYVEALEAGRWGDVPSNTHLRAFSLAIASACGGDSDHAALLVRRVLAATAPLAPGHRSFDTPAPAPLPVTPAPAAPVLAKAAPAAEAAAGRPALLAADGPMAAAAPAGGLAAASARLRSLPLTALLALMGLAGALSYGAAWGVEQWKHRQAVAVLNAAAPSTSSGQAPSTGSGQAPSTGSGQVPVTTKSGEPALSEGAAHSAVPARAEGQERSGPVLATSQDQAPAAAGELVLRARRACWLVLSIDGKRLPTVTMQDGDKLRWPVNERAILLAGNIGALRVWWRGDNLGYLGELGQRANGMVFERGKAPRQDKGMSLALPSGVPE